MPLRSALLVLLLAAVPLRAQDAFPLPAPQPDAVSPDDDERQHLAHQLCEAIDRGDLAAVTAALDAGASPNNGMGAGEGTTAGRTPLIHAVLAKNVAALDLLVARGARLDNGDDHRHTALHYAALTDDLAIAKHLVQLGARPDRQDDTDRDAADYANEGSEMATWFAAVKQQHAALLAAVAAGNFDDVRRALAEGASPNANDGATSPLLAAVRRDDLALVEELVASACRVDLWHVSGFDADTPLGVAAAAASLPVLERLLRVAPVPQLARDDALACAAGRDAADRGERVRLLLAAGARPSDGSLVRATPLAAAARHGDLPTMAQLLAAGTSQGAVDEALLRAIDCADLDAARATVRALLAIGADPSRDHFFHNALGGAAVRGDEAILELLLPRANQEALDTAVAQAAADGATAGLRWLCEHAEGRIRFAFKPGMLDSALVAAIAKDHRECLEVLLTHGADPNQDPSFGDDSPLVTAVRRQNRAAVERLLRAGADPRKAHEGLLTGRVSAISAARELGDAELLQLLVEAGPDAPKDPIGRTLAATDLVYADVGELYQLRYTNSDNGRSQTVYVRKAVEEHGSLRMQEIFSLCYDRADAPSAELLATAFQKRFGIGGLVLEEPGEAQQNWRIRFRLAAPCDLSAERLAAYLDVAQSTADALETEFDPAKEDHL